jgi:serine/threonine protein kinase
MNTPAKTMETGRLADFRIGRHLGTGAFGDVREAFDSRREIRVALKQLRVGDADALYRFKKEFRVLAGI